MKSLFDFAEDFRDVSFEALGVTEADNAVFCRLSYLDFSGFAQKTLAYIAENFSYTDESRINRTNKNTVKTEDLLKLLGKTERYRNVILSEFRECDEENSLTAFSASVFRITKEISFIAYRGTDETILSFYEDAELSYSFPIAAQLASLSYTNYILKNHSGNFILGGHSKGGNLAMFSFMFSEDEHKNRIKLVYNNDGPGFPKELAPLLFTAENCEKITNISPEDSIVGRMLEACGKNIIIKSSAAGVSQHNLFTWITEDCRFERAENFSMLSDYIEDTLTKSLDNLSPDDLKKAAGAIYEIARNSGLNTLDDINKSNYGNILSSIYQTVKSEDNAGSEAGEIVKVLSKSLINSVDIEKRLPDIDFKRIKELIENSRKKEDV